ncbi:hypothetical protein LVD15_19025 [Fulvivirga maritima]|uniref:hypothetical protein n=1 Tax=Fulvivirga maritima TaxID=2904247 RepID=UPI001F1AF86C|nr:hypothetical protein [Fulvivirga maritima]UII25379.1 hypothetical protein LVD15_19025 [Fulvivirga maritima]
MRKDRILVLLFLVIISGLILRINYKLTFDDTVNQKDDVISQLHFLEDQLKEEDLGNKMQDLFPEGYVFVNALYGLAWCELALSDPSDLAVRDKALKEALYAYECIDSNEAKWQFPIYLYPEYGIFYNGWRNYLLSKILKVSQDFDKSAGYKLKFKQQSDSIAQAIVTSKIPYLQSYGKLCWPADTYVAVASLANYKQLVNSKYDTLVKNWISRSKLFLDQESLLIPHRVDYQTGEVIESPRGSSMSLMVRMLLDIDPKFGEEQYDSYKDKFVSTILGLPCVREYPKGEFGLGDVDSGPVIFGVGFSATLASLGSFTGYGDQKLADWQYNTVNAFGFDWTIKRDKRYLLGLMPMGDAFIAWGRASNLAYVNNLKEDDYFFPWKFYIFSATMLILIWGLYFKKALIHLIRQKQYV